LENGVQVFCNSMKILDSGFRRNDEKKAFGTFYETINIKSYVRPLYSQDATPSSVSRRSTPPNSRLLAYIINGRYGYYRKRRLIHENRGKRECDK
jgi:hypothetical protein